MSDASKGYRLIESEEEAREIGSRVDGAWRSESIPAKQWAVVEGELERMRRADLVAPFAAFVEAVGIVYRRGDPVRKTVLEIGAGCGYYSEVLSKYFPDLDYTACDYSEAFQAFAKSKFAEIKYDFQDARNLAYGDAAFDLVISGCVLLHVFDWKKALAEAVRVSKRWVMLHRTPFTQGGPTKCYAKEAYGVECIEWSFSELEMMVALSGLGCNVEHVEKVQDLADGGKMMTVVAERIASS